MPGIAIGRRHGDHSGRLRALANPLIGVIGCVAALALAPAAAQDKPVTLRLTSNAPVKSPWANQINRFAQHVAEETKGTVKIEPFFAGQLGNEQDTMQQVARGRIDMGMFSAGAASLVIPEVGLLVMPMLFSSPKESDCVIDNHLTLAYQELATKKGLTFLGFGQVGTVDMIGKKPYANAGDVKGIKAVTYSKVQSQMWSALGANASFVGVPDQSSALQTGLIDAIATVMALYVPSGMNKIAPVLTRLDLWDAPSITVANKGVMDRLSPAQRDGIIKAAARTPAATMRAEIRGVEGALRDMHLKSGGKIVEATPAQRDEWRRLVTSARAAMIGELGPEGARLYKLAEQGRSACQVK